MFAPDIDLADVKQKPLPPRHAAYKAEVARIVLRILRYAKRPCSTQELTRYIIAERGMNTADKQLVRTVSERVGACLRHHGRGLGSDSPGRSRPSKPGEESQLRQIITTI
jgi:hypothetical protein